MGLQVTRYCTIRVAKTKALISFAVFAVTAKLICAFVFAYADCWYSHAVAHILVASDPESLIFLRHPISLTIKSGT